MNNSVEDAPVSEVRSAIGGVIIRALLALVGLGLGAFVALVIGLYAGWIGIEC
jgi:hypothetical protein